VIERYAVFLDVGEEVVRAENLSRLHQRTERLRENSSRASATASSFYEDAPGKMFKLRVKYPEWTKLALAILTSWS
jgi:hypothetical protein